MSNKDSKEKGNRPMTYQYERKYKAQCPFLRACGLDEDEAWRLQVEDVTWRDGHLCIRVKEHRVRERVCTAEHIAPVIPGQEQAVLRLVAGHAPEAKVFSRPTLPVPPWRVVDSLRRQYARALYLLYDPGRRLPGPAKREIVSPRDYDEEAARKVAAAVGCPAADPMDLMRWYVL